MDFHALARKDLQFLCKKNRIPANLTNVAMANALEALETVEGIEEIQEAAGWQSPKKAAVKATLDLPRTGRISARKAIHGDEPKNQPLSPRVTGKALEVTFLETNEEGGKKEPPKVFPKTPVARKTGKIAEASSLSVKIWKEGDEGSVETPKTAEAKKDMASGMVTRRSTRLSSMKAVDATSAVQAKGKRSTKEKAAVEKIGSLDEKEMEEEKKEKDQEAEMHGFQEEETVKDFGNQSQATKLREASSSRKIVQKEEDEGPLETTKTTRVKKTMESDANSRQRTRMPSMKAEAAASAVQFKRQNVRAKAAVKKIQSLDDNETAKNDVEKKNQEFLPAEVSHQLTENESVTDSSNQSQASPSLTSVQKEENEGALETPKAEANDICFYSRQNAHVKKIESLDNTDEEEEKTEKDQEAEIHGLPQSLDRENSPVEVEVAFETAAVSQQPPENVSVKDSNDQPQAMEGYSALLPENDPSGVSESKETLEKDLEVDATFESPEVTHHLLENESVKGPSNQPQVDESVKDSSIQLMEDQPSKVFGAKEVLEKDQKVDVMFDSVEVSPRPPENEPVKDSSQKPQTNEFMDASTTLLPENKPADDARVEKENVEVSYDSLSSDGVTKMQESGNGRPVAGAVQDDCHIMEADLSEEANEESTIEAIEVEELTANESSEMLLNAETFQSVALESQIPDSFAKLSFKIQTTEVASSANLEADIPVEANEESTIEAAEVEFLNTNESREMLLLNAESFQDAALELQIPDSSANLSFEIQKTEVPASANLEADIPEEENEELTIEATEVEELTTNESREMLLNAKTFQDAALELQIPDSSANLSFEIQKTEVAASVHHSELVAQEFGNEFATTRIYDMNITLPGTLDSGKLSTQELADQLVANEFHDIQKEPFQDPVSSTNSTSLKDLSLRQLRALCKKKLGAAKKHKVKESEINQEHTVSITKKVNNNSMIELERKSDEISEQHELSDRIKLDPSSIKKTFNNDSKIKLERKSDEISEQHELSDRIKLDPSSVKKTINEDSKIKERKRTPLKNLN